MLRVHKFRINSILCVLASVFFTSYSLGAAFSTDREEEEKFRSRRHLHSAWETRSLVLDPYVHLLYFSDRSQGHLDSSVFRGCKQPDKVIGSDCAVFRSSKKKVPLLESLTRTTPSPRETISAHSAAEKEGYLGILGKSKASHVGKFGKLATSLEHGSHLSGMPKGFLPGDEIHPQSFEKGEGMLEEKLLNRGLSVPDIVRTVQEEEKEIVRSNSTRPSSCASLGKSHPVDLELVRQKLLALKDSPLSSIVSPAPEREEGAAVLSSSSEFERVKQRLRSLAFLNSAPSPLKKVTKTKSSGSMPPPAREEASFQPDHPKTLSESSSVPCLSPESYFVTSPGQRVVSPRDEPYSSIAHLKLVLEDTEGHPVRTYLGTGCVIQCEGHAVRSGTYVLSAAHNVYLRAYETGVSKIEVYPGLSPDAVHAKAIADLYIVHPAYVSSEDESYKKFDIAIIKVAEPFGEHVAKLPLKIFSEKELEKALIQIWGYPAMVHEITRESPDPLIKVLNGQVMYQMDGTLLRVDPNQLYYNASTYGGQSGAPVVKDGGICGVHTYGGSSPVEGNCGTRISPDILSLLWRWIHTLESEESPESES